MNRLLAKTNNTLVERYGQYTTDYDTNTSVKRIKTLRNSVVSITAVWITNYGLFTIEWRVFTWKVRCPLSHVILTMWLPLNTELYGEYLTENDTNATENDAYTTVYDTVSTRVTNHPGTCLVTVTDRFSSVGLVKIMLDCVLKFWISRHVLWHAVLNKRTSKIQYITCKNVITK